MYEWTAALCCALGNVQLYLSSRAITIIINRLPTHTHSLTHLLIYCCNLHWPIALRIDRIRSSQVTTILWYLSTLIWFIVVCGPMPCEHNRMQLFNCSSPFTHHWVIKWRSSVVIDREHIVVVVGGSTRLQLHPPFSQLNCLTHSKW